MLKVSNLGVDIQMKRCYSIHIPVEREDHQVVVIHIYLDGYETADYTDIKERWGLSLAGVSYSLMSHLELTPEDARLHFINLFQKMTCKNGYGFNSELPTKEWSDDL